MKAEQNVAAYDMQVLCVKISEWSRLPEDHAKFYAAEVLDAFEYLHANDIIHRDVKGANILVDAVGANGRWGCMKPCIAGKGGAG